MLYSCEDFLEPLTHVVKLRARSGVEQLDLHEVIAVEVPWPMGVVPHHLPGTNEFLAEFPAFYGVPAEVAAGGAETMYPEYMKKAGQLAIQRCQRYCLCTGFADCFTPQAATNRSQ